MIISGDILSHRQGKGGLTHRRTTCHNYQIAGLPTRSDIVKLVIARCHTCQTILIGSCSLNALDGLRNNGIDLCIILLHVPLTQLKERALGLLHQFVDIIGLIESFRLYHTGEGYELSGQEFLRNNIGVVLNISR